MEGYGPTHRFTLLQGEHPVGIEMPRGRDILPSCGDDALPTIGEKRDSAGQVLKELKPRLLGIEHLER